MNQDQLKRMGEAKGFIAALDQSGGSTPKALRAYGIEEDQYNNEDEMFDLVHEMRTASSPPGLQERLHPRGHPVRTDHGLRHRRQEDRRLPVGRKGVPFLKIDKGLRTSKTASDENDAGSTSFAARQRRHIFGTKNARDQGGEPRRHRRCRQTAVRRR